MIQTALMQKKNKFCIRQNKDEFFDYQNILTNSFVLLKDKFRNQNLALFQDTTSIHKYVTTSDWLSTKSIKTLKNSAKNSYLNLIENF